MAFDGAILQNQLYPKLAPNEALSESWVRMFVNKLQANQDNLIESTRLLVRNLEEDYQTADAYVVAEFTEEIGVLTTAQGAQAGRITTLEAQVQTAGTGLLARVSVTESAIATLDGRVSAYYGIKVQAMTNIASLELMASGGGTPSAVVLTSSRFIINADSINFGSATVFENTENTFYTVSGGRRYRWSGPFGASDDVLMWFGPNATALGSETRTNGYWSFGTDGKVYYSGSELAPATAFAAYFDNISPTGPIPATSPDTTQTVTMTIVGGTAPYTVSWDGVAITGVDVWALQDLGSNQYRWNATTPPPGGSFLYENMWTATVRDSAGRTVLATVYPSLTR